jgi:hypothetical protein
MFNTIALEDLDSVVGGHCTCAQQGADPSGGQQPSQQPQQQPGGEQQPQQGALTAEQVLQSIAGLIGQFMQQRGGQQQPVGGQQPPVGGQQPS